MTFDKQRAIDAIRKTCVASNPWLTTGGGREVVLDDILSAIPMDDGSIDHSEKGIVFISVAPEAAGGERRRFQWNRAKPLSDQSEEALQFIAELVRRNNETI
jgi:hypothetical protein